MSTPPNVSGGYTNALAKQVTYSPGLTDDRRPAFSPRWQASALLRYEWDLTGSLRAGLQSDGSYRSTYFTQLSNRAVLKQSGYPLINLRASLAQQEWGWELEAAVKNLSNERYATSQFDTAVEFGNATGSYSEGRMFEIAVA